MHTHKYWLYEWISIGEGYIKSKRVSNRQTDRQTDTLTHT